MRNSIKDMKRKSSLAVIFPDDPGKVLSNTPRLPYNCLVKGEYDKLINIHYETINTFCKDNYRYRVTIGIL